ncbi:MAG: hypothetical protein M3N13_04840 [Candidatus Eremiobacteraeota bacterium]|nr:hypothetical protein [Candidatus Eremiobacteraeota bacterium]
MTLFPMAALVTVMLNGRPVRGYAGAFEVNGHIFAPVRPYVTRIAERLWYAGDRLAIERDGRIVYVRVSARNPDALERSYVPLGVVLRGLGVSLSYSVGAHVLTVRTVAGDSVATPSPFDPAASEVRPNRVFTPAPVPTARPIFNGPALPRRTPLPLTQAAPTPRSTPQI